jgi:predicted transcriptional regulator
MDYILQIFKGLANERRLKIIELLLEKGKLSIEDIALNLEIPFASCCRNLKILEKVYLVNSHIKDGKTFYTLNQPSKHLYNRLIIKLIKTREKRLSKVS